MYFSKPVLNAKYYFVCCVGQQLFDLTHANATAHELTICRNLFKYGDMASLLPMFILDKVLYVFHQLSGLGELDNSV